MSLMIHVTMANRMRAGFGDDMTMSFPYRPMNETLLPCSKRMSSQKMQ